MLILAPKVMIFSDEAFGRWLGHEVGDLTNEISSIMKEAPKRCFASSAMWVYNEKLTVCRPELAKLTLWSGTSASKTISSSFLLFISHLSILWHFVTAAWTNIGNPRSLSSWENSFSYAFPYFSLPFHHSFYLSLSPPPPAFESCFFKHLSSKPFTGVI